MFKRFLSSVERLAAERPVFLAFLVFVGATLVVIPVSLPFYLTTPYSFLENVLGEAHGMLFDLLVIGWFGFWLTKLAERRQKNNRYREEIEDFLGWSSPEATLRIVGNLRRLNRGGVTKELHLTEAFLDGANLAGVTLQAADLWGTHLNGATLRDANLTASNLAGAHLNGADLERAVLARADLRGTTLHEADLERAVLTEADLRGANLTNADLQYALLEGANLERTTLSGANLRRSILAGANLRGTNLENAHLGGALFHGARLHNTRLNGANLVSTDFTDAHLPTGDDLLALFKPAKTLFGAQFDTPVKKQLTEAFPYLFQLAHAEEASGIRPLPKPQAVSKVK